MPDRKAAASSNDPRELRTASADIEAEAAVLSAVMLSPAAFDEIRDMLAPDDFYSGAHRTVYQAILEVDAAGGHIDTVTLAHRLTTSGKLQQIGGTPFLAQLVDATPSVAHVIEHAGIIRSQAQLRRALGALRTLAAEAARPETSADVAAFLQRCEAEIFQLNAGAATQRDTGHMLHELMASALVELDPSKPRAPRGVSTGLGELDTLTLGLGPGELWYVAARPGMGKTALALGIAHAVAATGRHAFMFSMEMTAGELRERMISSDASVPYRALQMGKLSGAHWDRVVGTISGLSHLPMVIDDAKEISPSRLRSRFRRHATELRKRYPGAPAIVVVDYVQLMSADAPRDNRNAELEEISRGLKLLAGEFKVTVLALAQLNRGNKDRADKRPTLTDLRGSGALEQDADKVLFIHRAPDEDDGSGGEGRVEAELYLAKGRNAGTGRVTVSWQPWCVRFLDSQMAAVSQEGFHWNAYADDE